MGKTIDFDLNEIPGLKETVVNSVQQIHKDIEEKGSQGKRDLVITLSFKSDDLGITITPKIKTNLAKPDALTLTPTYGVRENGTIRLEPEQQESLFKKSGAKGAKKDAA